MKINIYDLIYLVISVFGTYIIYRFMRIFFNRTNAPNKKVEFLSYCVYYILISVLYLYVNIPIVFTIFNTLSFVALSYNYKSNLKNRINAVLLIYIILMVIETIIVLTTGYFSDSFYESNPKYSSIIGMILIRIVSFIVILLISNYKNVKKGISIPNSYWLSIFLIPLGSFYIILVLLSGSIINPTQLIISISSILIINITAFYIYDFLNLSFEEKINKRLLSQEKKYYIKQFELIKSTIDSTKALKHDLINHLTIIELFIKKDENEKALEYVTQVNGFIDYNKEFASSGNMVIDSILNYKLQEAESKGAMISLELIIPSDLNLVSFDMVVVLGNLLDNSIRAISGLDRERSISIDLRYKNGILFIHVENTFDGNILVNKDMIVTSKMDRENHGLGLKNIRKVLEKYNGTMEINYDGSKFIVDALMYIGNNN